VKKLWYVVQELIHGISHTASATLNTIVFGGDMFTSTSAKAHLEQDHPAWANRRKFINALFFWQEDHCKSAWETDYKRALQKVERNRP
jgi:hypothetical protein